MGSSKPRRTAGPLALTAGGEVRTFPAAGGDLVLSYRADGEDDSTLIVLSQDDALLLANMLATGALALGRAA